MFYTEDRINNWIERIREDELDLESGKGLEVFDKMLDDYIIACLNLLRSIREREITKKDALRFIEESKPLLDRSYDVGDEVKAELLEMTKENMRVVARGLELVISGKVSRKTFEKLLEEAIKKEKSGDLEGAFEDVARMAAKALAGEKLPEDLEIPDEDLFVIGWLDAIDAISTIHQLNEIDRTEVEDELE